jgi:hypothetical protein
MEKDDNLKNIIKYNNNSFEKESTFKKIKNLQIIIKNEHILKEKCKYSFKYLSYYINNR